jgi:hypothetical protein
VGVECQELVLSTTQRFVAVSGAGLSRSPGGRSPLRVEFSQCLGHGVQGLAVRSGESWLLWPGP